jgi:hypothetical protein
MVWIHLAQDRDQWRALVNIVMDLRFHALLGISYMAEQVLPSQKGLGFKEL